MEGSTTQFLQEEIEEWPMNRIVYHRNKMLAINKHRGSSEKIFLYRLCIYSISLVSHFADRQGPPIIRINLNHAYPLMIFAKFA